MLTSGIGYYQKHIEAPNALQRGSVKPVNLAGISCPSPIGSEQGMNLTPDGKTPSCVSPCHPVDLQRPAVYQDQNGRLQNGSFHRVSAAQTRFAWSYSHVPTTELSGNVRLNDLSRLRTGPQCPPRKRTGNLSDSTPASPQTAPPAAAPPSRGAGFRHSGSVRRVRS